MERFKVTEELTMEDVRTLAGASGWIFYGANTCWWTADPANLYKTKPITVQSGNRSYPPSSLPCDPRGGMLFQTHDVDGFLKVAEENAAKYGKHGLRAFLAAYHGVIVVEKDGKELPTCFDNWQRYNDLLDGVSAVTA